MNQSLSSQFISQLIDDTISGKVTWDYFSNFDQGFIDKNPDLKQLSLGHAHSTISEKKSYFANINSMEVLFLLKTQIESMKGDPTEPRLFGHYSLHVLKHELGDCITLEIEQNELVKLATIVRNLLFKKDSNSKSSINFMKKYLDQK